MSVTAFINFMVSAFMSGLRASTQQELRWLASVPVEMQPYMRVQIELQKEQELLQMLTRTFDAICGWQKEEEILKSSVQSTSHRPRTRYARR